MPDGTPNPSPKPSEPAGNLFMEEALRQAELAGARAEVPVGAVLVHEGRILAADGNRTLELHDPTAHAEVLVIRAACKKLGSQRLPDCDLYVTLEPCPMCAGAISFARIRRLYFGAGDEKGGAVEHGTRFFCQPTCHHAPDVYSGISERPAALLLKTFFKSRRIQDTDL
ncbi:nucleoside deaminase [Roseibium suaedae]|uniref:tRNA-specific adenosine deaminase n=1 Tax=Roseibium suaedae TaxID=735517 RepID=A0A1M7APM1_9HYPH|nr:nucleoside deaminase [Roseibium suaedae]SHL44700.1 tRNA(adenine34) deaminase [Roseibium suaedae]